MLRDYESSTGQLLSPGICSLMLGQKCTKEDGEVMASILKVERTVEVVGGTIPSLEGLGYVL
jgi:hypothetical protein